MKADLVGLFGAQLGDLRLAGPLPAFGPIPPRGAAEPLAQDLERGKPHEVLALLVLKVFEVAPARIGGVAKPRMAGAQRRDLGARDAGILHHVRRAQRRNLRFEPERGEARKLIDRVEIDVERIEKLAAARRVRARILRAVGKQRMQRIEPDGRAAQRGHRFDECGQIAEIAMAPVARRPQRIELDRKAPHPPLAALPGDNVPGGRTDRRGGPAGAQRRGELPAAPADSRRAIVPTHRGNRARRPSAPQPGSNRSSLPRGNIRLQRPLKPSGSIGTWVRWNPFDCE